MLPVDLFLLQLAIPVFAGLAAAAWLHEVTRRLLADLCGTDDRARFWTRCADVAVLAMPLVLVLLIAGTPGSCTASETADCVMRAVRETLAWTAFGILVAIGVIACAVGRHIPRQVDTPQTRESVS